MLQRAPEVQQSSTDISEERYLRNVSVLLCRATQRYILAENTLYSHSRDNVNAKRCKLLIRFPNYVPSDRLCGLVVRVPGYTTEMYCASCEVRTEFIYVT
jgi:hypothetical protein